jgi:23S rRNA (uracil1939-C5)-methyltransferase
MDLALGGYGVAKAAGKVMFLPLTAPGDLVAYRVERDHSRYAFGSVVEVLRPGESRVQPFCPVFGVCGGCQLQHVAYEVQLAAKRAWVHDALRRIAGVEVEVSPPVASPLLQGYRNKAVLHVHAGGAGFLRSQSHRIVEVESCPVLVPSLRDAHRMVGEWARTLPADAAFRVLLRSGSDGGVMAVVHHRTSPESLQRLAAALPEAQVARGGSRATVTFICGGIHFDAEAESFFQVNTSQHESMVETIGGMLSGGVLVDAHAGVGWPSLCLASRFREIACVEIARRSCDLGEANALRAGLNRVRFIRGSLASAHRQGALPERPDAMVVDPPRAGILPHDLAALKEIRAPTVVYVSCNPATLARDLKHLGLAGYVPRRVIPFDLFPHTAHVECIVLLNLRR